MGWAADIGPARLEHRSPVCPIDFNGTVLDGESGAPLIGATILESGTTNATSAGADGSFTLKVNGLPAALKVSFIGYVAQTLTVETASPIRVSLDIDAQLVDEVVVVGYGRQKKKVSTGSISKVTAKDIEGIAVPDVTSTLEGLTSGLIVNESSGQPGSGKSISSAASAPTETTPRCTSWTACSSATSTTSTRATSSRWTS